VRKRRLTKFEKGLIANQLSDRNYINQLTKENDELHRKLQARLDASMLDARLKLAPTIAQMVEACARMIHVVIGKEVM